MRRAYEPPAARSPPGRAWTLCAIDALGLPAMADRDCRITSADPEDSTPIEVSVCGGPWSWIPASAVVVAVRATGCGSLDAAILDSSLPSNAAA